MELSDVLRFSFILVGIILFCVTMTSLAKRRMTESFCMIWGGVSCLLILAGILLRPVLLKNYISTTGLVILALGVYCMICGAYILSTMISELMRKNRELAIQVSILQRECEKNRERLDKMEGVGVNEKDTDNH